MKKRTFISWNVNGIRSIARKEALKWIDESPVDFLALQEIKAQEEQIPEGLFEHHYAHRCVSASHRKGESGVALFTDVEPEYCGTCEEVDLLKEGRINEFHYGNIAFFNVYFPNGKRNAERLKYKMAFYDRFLEYIERIRGEGRSIIVCGDVNTAHRPIDLARPEANEDASGFLPVEREWMDRFLSHGYIDTFRHVHGDEPERYSWWSMRTRARARNVGWRIDYFFVSDDLEMDILDADILESVTGSDHCPVKLVMRDRG